jgi:dimethylhistidine N-methyltransferase
MSVPTKDARVRARRSGADPSTARDAELGRVAQARCSRFELVSVGDGTVRDDFARAVAEGLSAHPKRLACRHFYDAVGSRLFERICELPEYYLTRAEREILVARAATIAASFPPNTALIELGSGSSDKTRTLISAFLSRHGALRYVPIDISPTALERSALSLLDDYPELEILALAGEYEAGLAHLRRALSGPMLVVWLGSSIGNFTNAEAAQFLARVASQMTPDDRMLVGADLRKSPPVLVRAYDDAAGVTARFNSNLLARINRELGGSFDLAAFRHEARWNARAACIEMHLVSTRPQRVEIAALGRAVAFAAGESIHTESSHKYTLGDLDALAAAAGFVVERRWLDDGRRFSSTLLALRQDGCVERAH